MKEQSEIPRRQCPQTRSRPCERPLTAPHGRCPCVVRTYTQPLIRGDLAAERAPRRAWRGDCLPATNFRALVLADVLHASRRLGSPLAATRRSSRHAATSCAPRATGRRAVSCARAVAPSARRPCSPCVRHTNAARCALARSERRDLWHCSHVDATQPDALPEEALEVITGNPVALAGKVERVLQARASVHASRSPFNARRRSSSEATTFCRLR